MSKLSFRLAEAVNAGRKQRSALTRASILEALLRKRAEAAQRGLGGLEQQLRSQINWSLPIQKPAEEAAAEGKDGREDPCADRI
jgi:ABC-type antimicrobial peptide transport system ATPase subunit